MAAWTKADVRAYAVELTALADATIDYWIVEAATEIDDRVFGDLTRRAGANLTAHLIVMAGAAAALGIPAPGSGGGGLGAVIGVTVGQVSARFADTSTQAGLSGAQAAALARTRWGIEYLRLVRMRAGGPWLADDGT